MARLFTVASDETLIAMISHAAERLVIVAPGLSLNVAKALAKRLTSGKSLTEVSITLDTDPEICRLGYGAVEALDLVRPALEALGCLLQVQAGVRIGLIVADGDVLVYSPTPQLIEAGSTSDAKPNAIRLTGAGPQELAFACGAKDTDILGFTQEVGLSKVSEEAVSQAKASLEENPPRKFDLVRLERVFNYKLEFVEFSVEGCRLNTRVVPLPPSILGLAEEGLQERLRNSFRVFEAGVPFSFEIDDPDKPGVKITLTEEYFAKEAKLLRKKFIPLGSYGNLILKRHKPSLELGVARLRSLLSTYAELVKANITAKITVTRNSLIASLFPRVKAAPPEEWRDRSVDGRLDDGTIKKLLEEEVNQAFDKVTETFAPEIVCTFKGVRYETIVDDKEFRKRIAKHFSEQELTKLFSEYDASRAEDPQLI
jgi:hypothetical protein